MRILAVDDSALMRRLLKTIFEAEPGWQVEFARDGIEALQAIHQFQPDVVTLDVHMPRMDGLACLDRIMLERPCPVVMFSSLTTQGAKETLEALALGAVDFVTKPAGTASLQTQAFGPVLVAKIITAARARVSRSHRLAERVRLRTGFVEPPRPAPRKAQPIPAHAIGLEGERLVLVGCSTGGPPALDALLEPLPADFPWPIVIAQHMPASFTGPLSARLDRLCAISVSEVTQPTVLQSGCAYIAHGEADMIISRRGGQLIALPAPVGNHHWHPSVDRMVETAMEAMAPGQLLGVLMTGMGSDGAATMAELRQRGGRTIAEAEETAIVWGMPGELVRRDGADFIEPLDKIAARLMALAAVS